MSKKKIFYLLVFFSVLAVFIIFIKPRNINGEVSMAEEISLTPPKLEGTQTLEETLNRRRSIRDFKDEPISFDEFSQLLWAIQGITDKTNGFRTAPSAGALYPLEIFVVVGNVVGLKPGVYRYIPRTHSIKKHLDGDKRKELAHSALGQESIIGCAVDFVITGVYSRTKWKYGERAERYVWLEAGHSAQNLLLQATALNLGAVPIGAFFDDKVKGTLKLKEEEPLYIIPVGRKAQ